MSGNNSTTLGFNITTESSQGLKSLENASYPYGGDIRSLDTSVPNIMLATALILLVLITMFGNLLVILSFAVEKQLLQPFNLFILNLAVTDFLVAITGMAFYALDTILGYWPIGQIMCGVWIYFDFAMTFASVFTLVAISVDRFWCVTWAINYRQYNNKNKTCAVIAFIWLFVVAIWTPPFIGDRLKHSEQYSCIWEPSYNTEFVIFVAVIGHHMPCTIMVLCYVKVFTVMRKRGSIAASSRGQNTTIVPTMSSGVQNNSLKIPNNDCQTTSDQSPLAKSLDDPPTISAISKISLPSRLHNVVNSCPVADEGSDPINIPSSSGNQIISRDAPGRPRNRGTGAAYHQQREKRIFITLSYVLISYLLCWFPFYVVFDISAWRPDLVPTGLYSFFFWTSYANSTLNPFIYAYTSKEFRLAFIKVLRSIFKCSK